MKPSAPNNDMAKRAPTERGYEDLSGNVAGDNTEMLQRIDLKVHFACNNMCRFCVQGTKRETAKIKTTRELKKLLKNSSRFCKEVVFTGGEPTLCEDIVELVAYASSCGYETIQIQSNGRMFANQSFCKEIISAGANEIAPALHGHRAELHDYLTHAPGSFEQTVKGIYNARKQGASVITNTVITKSNFRHLPQIASVLTKLGVKQYQFAFVHALGTADKNFYSIVPRKTMVAPYVFAGLDVGAAAKTKSYTEAIPFCVMHGYERHVAERIIPVTRVFDSEIVISNYTEHRMNRGKQKGPECPACKHFNICEGPWREYPEKYGWSEFVPVT